MKRMNLHYSIQSQSTGCSVVSQARPTFAKEGKDLVSCVYKRCPAALYSVIQSHCSILSHDTLHHCLSNNSSLELGHPFHYYRSYKNASTILLREHAYSATGKSRVHYLKSGYVIKLIAFWWDKACICGSPDPSPLLRKWVGLSLARLIAVVVFLSSSRHARVYDSTRPPRLSQKCSLHSQGLRQRMWQLQLT